MMKIIARLLVIPSAFVRGWAIKLMWLWFVVPATGLKPIGTGIAYGLALFVTACSLCTADLWACEAASKNNERVIIIYPIAIMILLAFTVGVGYLVKSFFL